MAGWCQEPWHQGGVSCLLLEDSTSADLFSEISKTWDRRLACPDGAKLR